MRRFAPSFFFAPPRFIRIGTLTAHRSTDRYVFGCGYGCGCGRIIVTISVDHHEARTVRRKTAVARDARAASAATRTGATGIAGGHNADVDHRLITIEFSVVETRRFRRSTTAIGNFRRRSSATVITVTVAIAIGAGRRMLPNQSRRRRRSRGEYRRIQNSLRFFPRKRCTSPIDQIRRTIRVRR